MAKRKRGRPDKFTATYKKKMIAAKRKGLSDPQCCAVSDISYELLQLWKQRAKDDTHPEQAEFLQFIQDFNRAYEEHLSKLTDLYTSLVGQDQIKTKEKLTKEGDIIELRENDGVDLRELRTYLTKKRPQDWNEEVANKGNDEKTFTIDDVVDLLQEDEDENDEPDTSIASA